MLLLKQAPFVVDPERAAGADDLAAFVAGIRVQRAQGPELIGGNFVQMRQRFFAQREQRAFERRERRDQFVPVRHLTPIVAGLRLPDRTPQRPAFNTAGAGGQGCIAADLRGIRVCRIQEHIDVLLAHIAGQTLGTAVAADPYFTGQVSRHTAHPGEAVHVLWPQGAGNGQRFGDAAQQ